MNIRKIIVDELPRTCAHCVWFESDFVDYCNVLRREIETEQNCNTKRPSWCPLELEEFCEWNGEYGGYDEHGDMIFYSRKTGLMIPLQPYDYVALVKERDQLKAENERLREVLMDIANTFANSNIRTVTMADYCVMKAQQALNEATK